MIPQHSLILFSLMVLFSSCCGHIGGGSLLPLYQDISPKVYCGRALASALSLLCYDEPSNKKRSEVGSLHNAILPPYYKEQESPLRWGWMPPHKARSMDLPARRKRFVVSECCDKACSVEELLSYC